MVVQGYSQEEREAVYRSIRERRDVRLGFTPQPLEDELLLRLLRAAHQAPSVGLMQPWQFVLVRDENVRRRVHDIFVEAKQQAGEIYAGEKAEKYQDLKLAAILEAPQSLCVVCDSRAARGHGLGRQSMPQTAAYSTVCAIQNLWLAARAEGVGVGWVSILHPDAVKEALGIPAELDLIAYLCIGYVDHFRSAPELEARGWEKRIPLEDVLHLDGFGRRSWQKAEAR
jgi:5,6-dimethylbenzimidazole synthase